MTHWSFQEMQEAFGWDINQYVYFGGYPGSAPYVNNEARWRKYMRESIIAPAIEKDVLSTLSSRLCLFRRVAFVQQNARIAARCGQCYYIG